MPFELKLKLAIIIALAAVVMWIAFIFLGKIFYWLGLAAVCVIALKNLLGSYINKKKKLTN